MKSLTFFLSILILMSCKSESKKNQAEEEVITIENNLQSTEIESVNESNSIIFTIQIAALKNQNINLENLPNIKTYQENGLIKYRLGEYTTYEEATTQKQKLTKLYKGAFVQAMQNGLPIPITKAIK